MKHKEEKIKTGHLEMMRQFQEVHSACDWNTRGREDRVEKHWNIGQELSGIHDRH